MEDLSSKMSNVTSATQNIYDEMVSNVTQSDLPYRNYNGTNSTSNMNDTSQPVDYSLPTYAQILLTTIYMTITVLAIGGNVIVCYIVLAYQRMRSVTNYFIVNLAVSDILMAALCIPFSFIANTLLHHWPFGAFMCPVMAFSQTGAVFLSAFTLVAISIDRYIAIIFPLRQRMSTSQAFIIIILIWISAIAISLPTAILSRTHQALDYNGVMRDYCTEKWDPPSRAVNYTMTILTLQYFVPVSVLIFTYIWIGVVIWAKKPPGEAENNRDQRMAASKRKMIKMMITVVIIYAICWLPLHTITILGDLQPSIWHNQYMNVVWICSHWFAMSNSCYNPLVYCWMNAKYRNGFKHVFRKCCPFLAGCESKPTADTLQSMRRSNTLLTTVKFTQSDKRGAQMYLAKYPDDSSSESTEKTDTMPLRPVSNLSNGLNGPHGSRTSLHKQQNRQTDSYS
ncbi:unnamed protein product [Owenia fusiformis]|uniref:Uncharacterized protein n=1 Tax=Owenia fusiformis TaxID=6347 RepID=A0A8J1U673_OWEFU|nr:unnamed protein product [Owenia fusiformis]